MKKIKKIDTLEDVISELERINKEYKARVEVLDFELQKNIQEIIDQAKLAEIREE